MPNLLVDAFNVLHVVGVLPPELAGPDLAGLALLIERSRFRSDSVTLFCDGRPPSPAPRLPPGVRAKWSGPTRPADELLINQIRSTTTPRRALVITSDREILRAAERRRCQTMRSEAFLALLARDVSAPRVRRSAGSPEDAMPVGFQLPPWLTEEARREAEAEWARRAEESVPPARDERQEEAAKAADAAEAMPDPKARGLPLFAADVLREAAELLGRAEAEAEADAAASAAADHHDPAGPEMADVDGPAPSDSPLPGPPLDPLLVAFAQAMREAGEAVDRFRRPKKDASRKPRAAGGDSEPPATRSKSSRDQSPLSDPDDPDDPIESAGPRPVTPVLPPDVIEEARRMLGQE